MLIILGPLAREGGGSKPVSALFGASSESERSAISPFGPCIVDSGS